MTLGPLPHEFCIWHQSEKPLPHAIHRRHLTNVAAVCFSNAAAVTRVLPRLWLARQRAFDHCREQNACGSARSVVPHVTCARQDFTVCYRAHLSRGSLLVLPGPVPPAIYVRQ